MERNIYFSEKYNCENVNYQWAAGTACCLLKLIVTQFYIATDIAHLIQHRSFIQVSKASLTVSLPDLNSKKQHRWVMLDPKEAIKEHMLINKNPTELFLQLLSKLKYVLFKWALFPEAV